MATQNLLLAAIEAIYAAGIEEALWPDALAQITRTVGGVAAARPLPQSNPPNELSSAAPR